MDMTQLHPSIVPLQGGVNFRDQGGYRVSNGQRIKYGRLFRSGTLDELTHQDCQYLANSVITHVLDYRDVEEARLKPDTLWRNAQYKNIPANPVTARVTASLEELTLGMLEKLDPVSFISELYAKLPFNNPAYRYLVKLLTQPGDTGLVQHCAVGKDRTGVGSALVLLILGADLDTVMEDYLITETTLAPYRQKILEQLSAQLSKNGIAHFEYLFSAKPEFLDQSFKAIQQRYNSIDNWLEHEFGLTPALRKQIQDKYLAG